MLKIEALQIARIDLLAVPFVCATGSSLGAGRHGDSFATVA